ncbi:MAG: hypothetical protein CSA62_05870 [Planctomycetota bacterium]|nr:MAG: hypothetical protein CSA62_05870 [Planctomycetota bacterium]
MSYRLLLLSPIPVHEGASGLETLDLWARDLKGQCAVVDGVTLLARQGPAQGDSTPLPTGVEVVDRDRLDAEALQRLVREHDVVQVGPEPGLFSSPAMTFVKAARAAGLCSILGVSSNRAATTIMNAEGQSLLRRIRARHQASRMTHAVQSLAHAVDGVFLTGYGLVEMLGQVDAEVYVCTASWITENELIGEVQLKEKLAASSGSLSLCVAARLEPMKGVHLAIDALRWLHDHASPGLPGAQLEIFGEGAEKPALIQRAKQAGLAEAVRFGGTYPYPGPFFHAISRHDILLITNLNVEQPRIIFDAISQGLVPICPDSAPYQKLGVDKRVLYKRGDAESLAQVVQSFRTPEARADVMLALRKMAGENTLESMHKHRAEWVRSLLARRNRD